MYEINPDDAFDGNRDNDDKSYNLLQITDVDQFARNYQEDLAEILVEPNTTQSVATFLPDLNKLVKKGSVVVLTAESHYKFIGVVTEYFGNGTEEFTIRLLQKYYPEKDDSYNFQPKEISAVEPIDTNCTLEKSNSSTQIPVHGVKDMNKISILSVVSDEHLAQLIGCHQELLSYKL